MIIAYLPMVLTNTQNTNTSAPHQQMLSLDFTDYNISNILRSDLGNIRFYADREFSQPLYAWLESYSQLKMTFWLNIPDGIPANSQTTIYMTIHDTNTTFDGVYYGEAPLLSSTYAQYDNGMNVFNLYFNGNTPLSDFNTSNTLTQVSTTGPTGTTINVIEITNDLSNLGFTYIGKSISNQPIIAESSTQYAGNQGHPLQSDNGQVSIVDGTSTTSLNAISVDMAYGASYFSMNYYSNGTQTMDQNQQGSGNTEWHYASVTYFGSSATSWYGYIAPQLYSTSGGYYGTISNNPLSASSALYLGLIGGVGANYDWQTYINWMRARSYPPNGVMPLVFGGNLYQIFTVPPFFGTIFGVP
jgi:hypothetical protein